ncbi:DUF2254 domain-containing protein [Mongoliimonas terrestris]|uniref:DUF2254 domain-containing protein n=1 Tax=Mongoliimonas terrestris TaxID=1709001 RepID=UPI000949919F|nr:DUF2254 domain-containing protein [Mongoliimonas terrestris]
MISGHLDRLRSAFDSIRSRLWLIPALMSAAAAVLARAITQLDDLTLFADLEAWWYFGGDAQTARGLLSTLLSGMMTMASLVISITMVVLSLAANQLGPRLIWNFIRDRQIQAVIGLFFGTIVYLLVVLRSVHAESVPAVAVTVATALVGLCLFALLFHVHKVARSIVADTVINEVAVDLIAAVDAMPRAKDGEGAAPPALANHAVRSALSLGRSGYVQVIEYERLLRQAAKSSLILEIDVRAGHFVLSSATVVRVRSDQPVSDEAEAAIRSAFLIGSQRTATQDVEYAIRQLVEIAVRALSPGINDPFTATTALHRLEEAVERIMAGDPPDRTLLRDDAGEVRILANAPTLEGLVDAAFNQIRQASSTDGNAAVLIALADGLGQLIGIARTEAHDRVLLKHLHMVRRAADRVIQEPNDRADFEASYESALSLRTR